MRTFYYLYTAWVISLAGVLLSLIFGEILLHQPCAFCWYQRIALFPLSVILGIAAYRNDAGIVYYTLPLSLIGTGVALMQILQKHVPLFHSPGACQFGASCDQSILLAYLGLIGFALISLFLVLIPSLPNSRS